MIALIYVLPSKARDLQRHQCGTSQKHLFNVSPNFIVKEHVDHFVLFNSLVSCEEHVFTKKVAKGTLTPYYIRQPLSIVEFWKSR